LPFVRVIVFGKHEVLAQFVNCGFVLLVAFLVECVFVKIKISWQKFSLSWALSFDNSVVHGSFPWRWLVTNFVFEVLSELNVLILLLHFANAILKLFFYTHTVPLLLLRLRLLVVLANLYKHLPRLFVINPRQQFVLHSAFVVSSPLNNFALVFDGLLVFIGSVSDSHEILKSFIVLLEQKLFDGPLGLCWKELNGRVLDAVFDIKPFVHFI
jgi:hypothetical protein